MANIIDKVIEAVDPYRGMKRAAARAALQVINSRNSIRLSSARSCDPWL